ncbi:MAG: hypothetical protein LBM65_00445 [Oscillospiraceae bacterium]|jgi:hypothetical protein|nr:hypothetical protein [Oscillospiraceae bacterium]
MLSTINDVLATLSTVQFALFFPFLICVIVYCVKFKEKLNLQKPLSLNVILVALSAALLLCLNIIIFAESTGNFAEIITEKGAESYWQLATYAAIYYICTALVYLICGGIMLARIKKGTTTVGKPAQVALLVLLGFCVLVMFALFVIFDVYLFWTPAMLVFLTLLALGMFCVRLGFVREGKKD